MTENIIIADADYVDRVAFDLIVNFERMIGRRIPQADIARWVECIALDGGMRPSTPIDSHTPPSSPTTQVVLVHDTGRQRMENFAPGHYADELQGKAFTGPLGEFLFTCSSPEGLTTKDALLAETLQVALQTSSVQRVMVIATEQHTDALRRVLRQELENRRTASEPALRQAAVSCTFFTMQPANTAPAAQEILGYSLMAALGVKSSELRPEM